MKLREIGRGFFALDELLMRLFEARNYNQSFPKISPLILTWTLKTLLPCFFVLQMEKSLIEFFFPTAFSSPTSFLSLFFLLLRLLVLLLVALLLLVLLFVFVLLLVLHVLVLLVLLRLQQLCTTTSTTTTTSTIHTYIK
jgi:hypothetical protein